MQIKNLNHMGLIVANLDKTRSFYIDFLGFKEIDRPVNFMFDGAWFLAEPDIEVHVILAADTTAAAGIPEPGRAKTEGLATHFAFEVDNLDGYIERANELGFEIVGGPIDRGLGATQMYVQDPDGYQVELIELTGIMAPGQMREAIRN
ncbi:MAG: VOC family protein [Chloroflexota bacterium]